MKIILDDPMSNINGRLWLYCFQEILRLIEENPNKYFRASDEIAGCLNGCIVSQVVTIQEQGVVPMALLWSIPGMCNYFLNDEILLSKEMKVLKLKRLEPPSPLAFRDEQEAFEESRTHNHRRILSPSFCGTVTSFLYTALMNLYHTPNTLRTDKLAGAVLRVAMKIWKCPYTRVSYPSLVRNPPDRVWVTRSVFFIGCFMAPYEEQALATYQAEDELLPGMTCQQLLETLLDDVSFFQTSPHSNAAAVLMRCSERLSWGTDRLKWRYMTRDDLVELLDKFHDWNPPCPPKDPTDAFRRHTLREGMFIVMTRLSTNVILDMYYAADTMVPPPDPRTTQMLQTIRSDLIEESTPLVEIYLDIIGPRYRKAMEEANQPVVDFPQDCVELIQEFLLPEEAPLFKLPV